MVLKNQLATLDGFAARLEVLPFDKQASRQFGQVKAELELQGQKIGSYDAMIAGHARSQGLIVVTNNVREFKRVEGVRIVNWLEQA